MTIILPLQVNALHLEKAEQVIGQDIRFENIPWMNIEKDIFENPNTPLETNSIIPRPFSWDNGIYLNEGVHIHFVLPSYYKTFDDKGNLPAAPNRWYVKNARSGKEWIIESNYIWNINDPELNKHAICSYAEGEAGKDFNFHYVGRKFYLKDWKSKESNKNNTKLLEELKGLEARKKKEELSKEELDKLWTFRRIFAGHLNNLTALGWGSMSFDVHYPNCRSVFGFHDEDGQDNDCYSIIGWVDGKAQEYIVAGKFSLLKTNKEESNSPITDDFNVSIANTLPEALASLILEDEIDKDSTSLTTKLTLEEQFEALLNFDKLNNQKLDLVSRLRHNLHEKQFYQTKGITKWQFKELGADSKVEQILKELYAPYLETLKSLNDDQKKHDLNSFTFYSQLESLYLDWSNYLQELYVENKNQRNINDDLSSLKAKYETLIRFKNQLELEYNQILSQKINIEYIVKSSNNELIEEKACLVLGIEKENDKIDNQDTKIEDAVNEVIAALKDIQLERGNNINFEHVLPPSVVISSSKEVRDKQNLQKQDPINLEIEIDYTCDDISDKFRHIFSQYSQLELPVFCNTWNIYKVQWHTQFLPKKEGYYLENQNNEFQSNFINDSYQLDEQNADLIKQDEHAAISYSNNENNYYGESFVDDTIQGFLLNKIDNSISNNEVAIEPLKGIFEAYKDKLEKLNVVTLTLSDFNHLMTQRSTALSVLPLIPNGFENHQDLANNLSLLFTEHKENVSLFTPNRPSTFNPLRNGALRIARLRTIDSFGRVQFLNPKDKVLTTKQQTIQNKPDWVNLPPRLMQPAALKLDIVKTKTNDEFNPVIGYLLPSYLNQHLQFFDAFGSYLGSINEEGNWEPSPFDVQKAQLGATSYKICGNDDLIKAVDWFLTHSEDNPEFRSRIIQEIQTNLEHVQPENYQNPSLLETISSVPLAITKLSYELFTKGEVRYDIAKAKEIAFNHTKYQNKLGSIQFPIRFGDINQYNDGLIGYWHGLKAIDTFFINSETVRTFTNEIKIIKAISIINKSSFLKNINEIQSKNYSGLIELKTLLKPITTTKLLSKGKGFSIVDIIENTSELIHDFNSKNEETNQIILEFNKFLHNVLPYLKEINEISIEQINTSIFNKSTLENLTLENLDFKKLYNEKINSVKNLIQDLKQDNQIENIFEFLIEIINKKGHITKADVLKYFVENGNKIWTTLQKIGLIQVDKTLITSTIKNQIVIAMASKNKDKNNHVFLNDKPQFIYALIHPKAKVFFKTGILPEKHLIFPYNEIKNPLRKIELTLLTSPVLTPKDDLQISLLQDSRYKWSWIELEKSRKREPLTITNKPIKKRVPQEITVNLSIKVEDKLSRDEEKYKKLKEYIDSDSGDFFPEEYIYYISMNKYNDLLQNLEKEVLFENEINTNKVSKEQREKDLKCLEFINQYKTYKINSFNTSAANIPQLVLKEGWLSLKPTKI
ncbi:hypothetical protein B4N84_07665 [Flavobacterium sp. IR1]|nr:hypothetical protein B4N84_07665 [Flavobacterium sp. IR1]